MSERFQNDIPDLRAPVYVDPFPPLPGWLANRLLRPGERVEWVRGPWFNPSWERYITHPALLGFPLPFALAFGLGIKSDAEVLALLGFLAFLMFVLTIIVLGIANGYFTRLVVTDRRVVILQGYEICRSWSIDRLPPAMFRYGRYGDPSSRTIDLDAVKSMLGGTSDKFTDAKTILSFGKQLDRITKAEEDRR